MFWVFISIYIFRVSSPSSGVNIKNWISTKLETCVQVKAYLGREEEGKVMPYWEFLFTERWRKKVFWEFGNIPWTWPHNPKSIEIKLKTYTCFILWNLLWKFTYFLLKNFYLETTPKKLQDTLKNIVLSPHYLNLNFKKANFNLRCWFVLYIRRGRPLTEKLKNNQPFVLIK